MFDIILFDGSAKSIAKIISDLGKCPNTVQILSSYVEESDGTYVLSIKTNLMSVKIHDGDIVQIVEGIVLFCFKNRETPVIFSVEK